MLLTHVLRCGEPSQLLVLFVRATPPPPIPFGLRAHDSVRQLALANNNTPTPTIANNRDQTGQIERCEGAGKRRDAAGFAYYRRVTNTYSRAGLGAVFRVAWKNLFQQSPEGFKRYAYCFVDAGGTFDTIAEAQAAPLPQSFGGFSFEQVLFQGCGGFSWSVFDMKKDQSETTEDAFPTHQMCLVKTRLEIP